MLERTGKGSEKIGACSPVDALSKDNLEISKLICSQEAGGCLVFRRECRELPLCSHSTVGLLRAWSRSHGLRAAWFADVIRGRRTTWLPFVPGQLPNASLFSIGYIRRLDSRHLQAALGARGQLLPSLSLSFPSAKQGAPQQLFLTWQARYPRRVVTQ